MSYSEKDGQVVLTISREDYNSLIFLLGIATGEALRNGHKLAPHLEFLDRLNQGNPNYTPYQVGEKKS